MNIVFDIGGVLIDFSFLPLYEDKFDNKAELDWFLANVMKKEYWICADAGKSIADAARDIGKMYPDYAELVRLVDSDWPKVHAGVIEGTLGILQDLAGRGTALFAITNFPAEKFEETCRLYPFLGVFRDTVVSGQERIVKPDPRIYRILLERNGLRAEDCLFIDDTAENVVAAEDIGMQGHHFVSAQRLRQDLEDRGVL